MKGSFDIPQKDKKDLLVILDNLEKFSGKLLTQIANESEVGGGSN